MCENGLISFGSAWDGSLANATANATFEFPLGGAYLIAPLWSDVDISDPLREGEEILYEFYSGVAISETALVIVNLVSTFIEYQYNISFAGEWVFIATWYNVQPAPQESDQRVC